MIRELGSSLGRTVLDGIGRTVSRLHEEKSLPVDLLESDDAYLAVFDAPGATAADISVQFEDDTLSVKIDRFREYYDGYETVFPGRGLSLTGEVTLPEEAATAVDPDQAEATLTRDGTLEVLIPKTARGKREADADSERDDQDTEGVSTVDTADAE